MKYTLELESNEVDLLGEALGAQPYKLEVA